jgi:hypothetical protein
MGHGVPIEDGLTSLPKAVVQSTEVAITISLRRPPRSP